VRFGRQAVVEIIQPVAQTRIKAPAPQDLVLLDGTDSKYGVKSALASFVRQAELCDSGAQTARDDPCGHMGRELGAEPPAVGVRPF